MFDQSSSVFIGFDAAATVMRRRGNRYHMPGDVDTDGQAFRINIREVLHKFLLLKWRQ